MKSRWMFIIVFISGLILPFSTTARQGDLNSLEEELKGVDAKTALKIANQWKWSRKEIKSYIDSHDVIFKFPDGKTIKIPLPENEMMIAVAPYITYTHG